MEVAMRNLLSTLFFVVLFMPFISAQWVLTHAPNNVPIYTFAYNGSNVFAGGDLTGLVATGGTVFHSTNNGLDWTIIGITTDCPEIRSIVVDDENIFAGSSGGGVFLSTNMGVNWTNVSNGLTDLDVYTLLIAPNGLEDKNLYAGTMGGGIFLSTNNGINWSSVNNGLTDLGIYSLAYLQNQANEVILFAGTGGKGVFLSTNNGSSWTQTTLNSNYVWSLAVSGENIFAATGHLFLSTDRGASWTDVSNLSGFALATYGTNVFALTNWGHIFLSTNNGAEWTLINEGIIDTLVLAIGITDNYIFASGVAEGLWRRPLSELVTIIPVELTSFTAAAKGKEVTLNWSTATELNNQGFEVQRKFGNNDFVTVGSVKGHGTTTSPNHYLFVDKLIDGGKYFYRLKQMDYGGTFEYSNEIEVEVRTVDKFTLEQNYPNPFNPTTTIGYVLQEKSNAKLTLLNALGEEIAVLVNEEQNKGYHKVEFNGSKLTSGVYYYRLVAGNFNATKKLLLLK
jgi:hypothetical protein